MARRFCYSTSPDFEEATRNSGELNELLEFAERAPEITSKTLKPVPKELMTQNMMEKEMREKVTKFRKVMSTEYAEKDDAVSLRVFPGRTGNQFSVTKTLRSWSDKELHGSVVC